MKAVKNILFDLGAVLIDIDFEKVCKSFEHIGIKDFENQVRNLNTLLNIEKDNSKNLEMMIQNIRAN